MKTAADLYKAIEDIYALVATGSRYDVADYIELNRLLPEEPQWATHLTPPAIFAARAGGRVTLGDFDAADIKALELEIEKSDWENEDLRRELANARLGDGYACDDF